VASSLPELPPARSQHRLPVDAQEGRFLHRLAGVLATSAREVKFRLDDRFVAVVGQGEQPRVRCHDFRVAGRPSASALPPNRVGEHIIDLVLERADRYSVAAMALALRNRQRVQPGIGVEHYLRAQHHGQAHQFGIAPLMADNRRTRHTGEMEEGQRISRREESRVSRRKVNLRIAEDGSSSAIEHNQGIEPFTPREGQAAHQHMAARSASRTGDAPQGRFHLRSRYCGKVAIISCHRAFGEQDDVRACFS